MDIAAITDKLLDMNPDTIPKYVLLKDFKGYDLKNRELQNLYDEVCSHPFIKKYENIQNDKGFWEPFHGYTEGVIRKLLSFGLDDSHPCLSKVKAFLIEALHDKSDWGQFEKQDNPLWWPKMFVPLVNASMLSLIDSNHSLLDSHRKRWSSFARVSFEDGTYNREKDIENQTAYFGFSTKRVIPPFNYFNFLLLSPNNKNNYLDDFTEIGLVNYCMSEADGIYYIYNNSPRICIPIDTINRDSRYFWNWIRALSLIARFPSWSNYKEKYYEWIMSQTNSDGLWEFPKKFDYTLSNAWRGKNKVIDSSIFVLKLLDGKKGY